MKVRFLLILIVLLLFILAIPMQTIIRAGENTPDLNNTAYWYAAGKSKSENDSYQLISINWQAAGISTGKDYTLTSPQAPEDSSNGCCCTYLPCVFKDW